VSERQCLDVDEKSEKEGGVEGDLSRRLELVKSAVNSLRIAFRWSSLEPSGAILNKAFSQANVMTRRPSRTLHEPLSRIQIWCVSVCTELCIRVEGGLHERRAYPVTIEFKTHLSISFASTCGHSFLRP
jgi:hypothetical protein